MPRRAVALEYDGTNAPRIAATGSHELAEQIIAIAREHEVPLFENPELAELLAQLDLGDEISEFTVPMHCTGHCFRLFHPRPISRGVAATQ